METSFLSKLKLSSTYTYRCIRDGKVVWEIDKDNLVTNEGLDYAMNVLFNPESYSSPQFYCGLIKPSVGGPPSAEDTMASHAWGEYLDYSTQYRQLLDFSRTGVAEHTSTTANFMISNQGLVRGAFMTTDDIKGGKDGYLYGASYFQVNREVEKGDSLNVIIRVSATGT